MGQLYPNGPLPSTDQYTIAEIPATIPLTPPLHLARGRRTLKLQIASSHELRLGNALCAPHGFKLGLNSGGFFCLAPDALTA